MVSFDPRGYGESRPPVRDYPLDFYHRDAADGVAIMTALGHEKFSVWSSIFAPPSRAGGAGRTDGRWSLHGRFVVW